MPILSWQFPTAPRVTAQQQMAVFGLRVQVEVNVHPAVQKALSKTGEPVPSSIAGNAIIDTGCTASAIDLTVASKLGLKPIGRKSILTPAGQSQADQYSFSFRLMPYGLNLSCVAGLGAKLEGQGIIALIGMDLLSHCALTVNGPGGNFFLAY